MDLSPAESVLIDFVRGQPETDFNMSIATHGGRWLFTAASTSDGILVGWGNSFGESFAKAMDADGEPGCNPGDGEAAPAARAIKLVAGTDHDPRQARVA